MNNYRIYTQPQKSVSDSSILRIDLFPGVSLKDVKEIKGLDFTVHDQHIDHNGLKFERKTLYLTIN